MRYLIEFQYKPYISTRPDDEHQDKEISFENNDTALVPNVGDTVVYKYRGESRTFKVMSRNFSYGEVSDSKKVEECTVTIVVTDLADLRMRGRSPAEQDSVSDVSN